MGRGLISGIFVFGRLRSCLAVFIMLLAVGGCRSDLNQTFYQGAKRQDGLDTRTTFLWNRSPAHASGRLSISSTENFDNLINKTAFSFSNILNLRQPIRSNDLIMQYSVFDSGAPTFFRWAGASVPWKDNSDFRVLFAYHYLDRMIRYTDDLIELGYLPADTSGPAGLAWRTPICNAGAATGHSCETVTELQGAPVLPLIVAADSPRAPNGALASAGSSGLCSYFNIDYQFNGQPYCIARDTAGDWKNLWNNRSLARKLMFFRDKNIPTLNYVDEADSIARYFAYVLQSAISPWHYDHEFGSNFHLDSLLEGMADFFAAAYLRSDSVFRYSTYNSYSLNPNLYTGTLRGAVRDPANELIFPDAYLNTPQSVGRVVTGAFNDIRKLMQLSLNQGGVERLQGGACGTVVGCSSPPEPTYLAYRSDLGDAAWDVAVTLLYRSLYRVRSEDPINLSIHRFASAVVDECTAWAPCFGPDGPGVANVRAILEDRGLLSRRIVNSVTGARNQELSGVANFDHLVRLGTTIDPEHDDAPSENISRRWGLVAPSTVGWAPYLLNGSQEFANTDNIVSPCEVIVVFPNIHNISNAVHWGQAPPVPPAGFPAYPPTVAAWPANALSRGVDIVDLSYSIAEVPLGYDNFEHPDVGYIEPWQGLGNVTTKVLPYLQAGETTQNVIRNQLSRIYKPQKELFFDKPLDQKAPAAGVNVTRLRTPVGYIFRAPEDIEDEAIIEFNVEYFVYNEKNRQSHNQIHYIDHGDNKNIKQTLTLRQSLVVEAGGPNFCD